MTIRAAEPADIDAVRGCARKAYEIYVPRMGREPAPMVADFAASQASGNLYVLEHEGAVAGFVVFHDRDNHLHLENVAVHPAFQGLGLGRQLIDFAEEAARQSGFAHVELYTNVKMTENIPYYPSLGYEEIGCWQEDGFDRVFFRKEL